MSLGKVAEKAGVALVTARKVLRQEKSVRPYIRERVLDAMRELDYHPNMVARALRDKSLRVVPISVANLGEYYFGEFASRISRQLVEIGMEPALCFNSAHLMKMCLSFSTSGSILVTGTDLGTVVHELSKRQKVVTIDSNLPAMPSVGNVSIEFARAYRHLTEITLERGLRRIAIVSGHFILCLRNGWPAQKFPMVLEVLASAGLDTVGPDPGHVFASSAELGLWLDRHPGTVDAVFCENDLDASRVVGAMAARGLRTPDDILVVGCDNNCKVEGAWSIKLDTEIMAREAVAILKRLLDGETQSEHSTYIPEIIDQFDHVV